MFSAKFDGNLAGFLIGNNIMMLDEIYLKDIESYIRKTITADKLFAFKKMVDNKQEYRCLIRAYYLELLNDKKFLTEYYSKWLLYQLWTNEQFDRSKIITMLSNEDIVMCEFITKYLWWEDEKLTLETLTSSKMMLAVKNKILLESGNVECILKKCINHAVFDMMYHSEFEKLDILN
jgi:hypothetical protein